MRYSLARISHSHALRNNQFAIVQAPIAEIKRGNHMLAFIAAVFLVMWLLGFAAFHVTSGLIHILLILAVISLVMHFVRGSGAAV